MRNIKHSFALRFSLSLWFLFITAPTFAQGIDAQGAFDGISAEIGVTWAFMLVITGIAVYLWFKSRSTDSNTNLVKAETQKVTASSGAYVSESSFELLKEQIALRDKSTDLSISLLEDAKTQLENKVEELEAELERVRQETVKLQEAHTRELATKDNLIVEKESAIKQLVYEAGNLKDQIRKADKAKLDLATLRGQYNALKTQHETLETQRENDNRQWDIERMDLIKKIVRLEGDVSHAMDDTISLPDDIPGAQENEATNGTAVQPADNADNDSNNNEDNLTQKKDSA